VFNNPALGGTGIYDYVANSWTFAGTGAQLLSQLWGVGVTVVWSGVVSFICYKVVDLTIGLRVTEEQETEGLDTVEHGERGYSL
jgi:Amt family ammonium transporter